MKDLIDRIREIAAQYEEAIESFQSHFPEDVFKETRDAVIFWKCGCGEINAMASSCKVTSCVKCSVVKPAKFIKVLTEPVL